jgi:hypothetical protein
MELINLSITDDNANKVWFNTSNEDSNG